MERVVATIREGTTIVATDIEVTIEQTTLPGGLRDWRGFFLLPFGTFIDPDSSLDLEVNDGRKGKILVSKVQMGGSGPTRVLFQGNGPFA
jgi:hypothetical protein